ncbi:MAG: CHAT domain-containing protein [Terracidiphilus sp.]|jgi:CHAT domain-containing protein
MNSSPRPAGIPSRFASLEDNPRSWVSTCIAALLLVLLIPLKDNNPVGAQAVYEHAWGLFQQGRLTDSQRLAAQGFEVYRLSNPPAAIQFQLLEAEALAWRGMYDQAMRILDECNPDSVHPEERVRKLAIEANVLIHQQQYSAAGQRLTHADILCNPADYPSCGMVLRMRGILAVRQEEFPSAWQYFLKSITFSQVHHDRYLEASTYLGMGWAALQINHYDEAAEWSRSSYRIASELGAENIAQAASGNLGWSYYQLGDAERALDVFLAAEGQAAKLGNLHDELKWISNAGYVYHDSGDSSHAAESYRQALQLARQIGSREDIVIALEDLARVSVEADKLDDASAYIDQVAPMEMATENRLSANIMLTQGILAAARRQDQQAEKLFRAVQEDADSLTTIRLDAGDELAKLYEQEGNRRSAEDEYKSTLTAFESARAQLKQEDSRLPFAANATGIYDDYIHLLIEEGRSEEALAAADSSRARTLAQGLGLVEEKPVFQPGVLNPCRIAKSSGATLLFYWLDNQSSYLWVITPAKITLLQLPAQDEIVEHIARYRKAMLEMEDLQRDGNQDGQALYALLVAPAARLIRPKSPVMVLADGALSRLNFETLLAPGAGEGEKPDAASRRVTHYWIEDVTVLSAPSLDLLAAARPARSGDRKLLLLGNPVSRSADYPSLPLFGAEMSQIARHFAAQHETVFTGSLATPSAYLSSKPAQYAYIHFVSHATASRTDPLDSAIILSDSTQPGGQESEATFKLYAREIIQHPIDARLVTISACYGSGSRSYAGEGLVGLSWAFLRAGAHSVIGALWEVSDESTPRLMDSLYQGLEDGKNPGAALRNAKLNLLHSRERFRLPFYWAPFQMYTRQ